MNSNAKTGAKKVQKNFSRSGILFFAADLKVGDDLNIDRQSETVEFSGSAGPNDDKECEKEISSEKGLIVLVISHD